jgi:hypothetical protein
LLVRQLTCVEANAAFGGPTPSPASGIDNKGEREICRIFNTAWGQLDEESREKKETF